MMMPPEVMQVCWIFCWLLVHEDEDGEPVDSKDEQIERQRQME